MRSELLWQTDLGLNKITSGELSPGVLPFELRFYPNYGFGLEEWFFEIGVTEGENPIKEFTKVHYDNDENFFIFYISFKELMDPSYINIIAKHVSTGKTSTIWEGEILPNKFSLNFDVVGLSSNWNVIDGIKKLYPNINTGHFAVPTINVKVGSDSIIVSKATSIEDHTLENAPLIFKGFHKNQTFDLLIDGHVIGYGGKGGDAGMSTVTDKVDILYPTDGLNGGNPIFIEFPTQQVNVTVSRYGHYQVGKGGKGASSFMVNSLNRRYNQLGNAGLGGYPNGLNGNYTDVHYRTKMVTRSNHAEIILVAKKDYIFKRAEIDCQQLPNFPSKSSIAATKDGKDGVLMPKGVKSLKNEGGCMEIVHLTHTFGSYITV